MAAYLPADGRLKAYDIMVLTVVDGMIQTISGFQGRLAVSRIRAAPRHALDERLEVGGHGRRHAPGRGGSEAAESAPRRHDPDGDAAAAARLGADCLPLAVVGVVEVEVAASLP
jgi:hypothetical protein